MKKRLLRNLRNDVYCRLQPSKVAGVGVFAIKMIPPGINPFKKAAFKRDDTINLTKSDILSLDPSVQRMLEDFIHPSDDGKYTVPKYGLNDLDITFYINHNDNPNVDIVDDGKSDFLQFRTNRVILPNEELYIDYRKYKDAELL